MSRLCRLRTKTHGEDGQWTYEEITKLREQVEAQVAEIKTLEIEFGDVRDSFLYYKEMTRAQAAVIEKLRAAINAERECWSDIASDDQNPDWWRLFAKHAVQRIEQALAIPTDSTQILDEVRRAERERIIAIAEAKGWAMRNEDPFEDAVREICAIRAMG